MGNRWGRLRIGVAGAIIVTLVATAGVASAALEPLLNYYGGEILANPKLVQVVWGTGTFLPEVTNSTASNVPSFLDGYTRSQYFAWMSEYSAGGRTIGPGSFGGRYTITPADENDGATVDDIDDIQPELKAQIDAQHLPAPDANTFYVVFFPSEKLKGIRAVRVSAGYGVGRGASTVTIVDDDVRNAPTVGVGDSSVIVGAAGDRQLAFAVTLSRPLTKTARVKFTLTALTAVKGSHYTGVTSGILTLPAGSTTVFQAVTVKPNQALTSAKTVRLGLSELRAPAGTRLVRTQGIGTILAN